MARFLEKLGRWCVRRRRTVVEAWIVLMVVAGYLGAAHGGIFMQQSSLPGTETQQAVDTMSRDFPSMTGPSAMVVFTGTDGVSPSDWRVALNIGKSIDNLAKLDRVSFVVNPYAPGMGGLKNRNAVVAQVYLKGTMSDVSAKDVQRFDEAVEPARKAGVAVRYGGIVSMIINQPKGGFTEAIGLVMALVVLLLAFGSYLAAGIPIIVSLCALVVAYSLIHFGASLTELPPIAPMIAAMLGLGAGIDYALFIVTRYRRQLEEGDDVETAVGRAMAHSGHAVVFAGGTVVFAICGLFLSGVIFIGRTGIAAALSVALMVAAALTLLPAVLGFLGHRIDRYRLPRVRPDRSAERWMRWGRHVDRNAWPYALGAIVVLAALSIPTLSLKFGVTADSIAAKSSQSRQAYDIVAKEFGPGRYSPFAVVARIPETAGKAGKAGEPGKAGKADTAGRSGRNVPTINGPAGLSGLGAPQAPAASATPAPAARTPAAGMNAAAKTAAGKDGQKKAATGKAGGTTPSAPAIKGAPDTSAKPDPRTVELAKELRRRMATAPGVASVAEPVVVRNTAVITVFPKTAPHAEATTALVHRLRSADIPAVAGKYPGAQVYLGGENPAIIDVAAVVQSRMLKVVLAVVGVALILLVIAFRSIVVPIKAALMNLLSIGASYGVVTAVFQWGWGIRLLGVDQPVPIMSFIPLFMFALVFGLSMDYEVFLLSRIKEEYDLTGDPHESVVVGIGGTARLITSAALIMIAVFSGFLPQPDPTVKMMSLGLAVAVIVDATIVRLVLVPALMSLLGHANWWWPFRGRAVPAPHPHRPDGGGGEGGHAGDGGHDGDDGDDTDRDGDDGDDTGHDGDDADHDGDDVEHDRDGDRELEIVG